jgi:hypothetical protein
LTVSEPVAETVPPLGKDPFTEALTAVTPVTAVEVERVTGPLMLKVVPSESVPVRVTVSTDCDVVAEMVAVAVTGWLVMFVLPDARFAVSV